MNLLKFLWLLPENSRSGYDSFESGAALAYCNPDCYQDSITQEEFDDFRNIVRKNFNDMADDSGAMELLFNRIELVAKKP